MKRLLILAFLLFIIGCTSIPVEKQCTTHEECVPATCCGATDAVNVAYAPDCSKILCAAVCTPGTIDCGQGEISCISGQCEVVLVE
jgi:hypothetical protein